MLSVETDRSSCGLLVTLGLAAPIFVVSAGLSLLHMLRESPQQSKRLHCNTAGGYVCRSTPCACTALYISYCGSVMVTEDVSFPELLWDLLSCGVWDWPHDRSPGPAAHFMSLPAACRPASLTIGCVENVGRINPGRGHGR